MSRKAPKKQDEGHRERFHRMLCEVTAAYYKPQIVATRVHDAKKHSDRRWPVQRAAGPGVFAILDQQARMVMLRRTRVVMVDRCFDEISVDTCE